MNTSNHRKKPITASAASFFKHLFPVNLSDRVNKLFDLDRNRKKIKFRSFCLFIISTIINQPNALSLRDLEAVSKKETMQNLTGQETISHTSIAERLKSIPSESLEIVLNYAIKKIKRKFKKKGKFPKGMKVFDVTTYSVSAEHYKWAAKRQSRGNIRFLFVMDSYTGTPDAIADASKNLNDNKVFKKAISIAKGAKYLVFDKGFNSFKILKEIVGKGQHFITRFKENYIFELISTRKINPNDKLEGDWIVERDEVGYIGKDTQDNRLIVRKITCRNTIDNSTFIVMSDDRNLPANKIVNMYAYRWPIEVLFRHIKTNLHIVRFPSHDPQGVLNWMVLVMISIIFIQLMANTNGNNPIISLMLRESPFRPLIRNAQLTIDQWIMKLIKGPGG